MSTISAGLVQVNSLTVNGLGAGAVTASNLNFNNLNVADNLMIGTEHVATQSFVNTAIATYIPELSAEQKQKMFDARNLILRNGADKINVSAETIGTNASIDFLSNHFDASPIISTCIKYNDNFYSVLPAHSTSKSHAVAAPKTQMVYENLVPDNDMDFSEIELLLRRGQHPEDSPPNDGGMCNWPLSQDSLDSLDSGATAGIGQGSDVWGMISKKVDGSKEYFAFQGTTKGLVIMKYHLGINDAIVKSIPYGYLSGFCENLWSDIKSYDVCTMDILLDADTSGSVYEMFARNQLLELDFTTPDDESNKFVIKILSSDYNTVDHTVVIRCKTEYTWVANTVINSISFLGKKPVTLSNASITSSNRQMFIYWSKEMTDGHIQTIDVSPMETNDEVVITHDFFNATKNNVDADGLDINWEVVSGTTEVKTIGYLHGAHNVYVNEEQGKLYICIPRSVKYNVGEDETDKWSVNTIVCDILDNPAEPVIKGFAIDETDPLGLDPINSKFNQYSHDCVVESFDKSEQNTILGIPLDDCTDDLMYIYFGSNADVYVAWDVTDINNIKVISNRLNGIKSGGYYHQGWFTTDKSYIVVDDEVQTVVSDPTVNNTIHIIKMYNNINYTNDGTEPRLTIKHVQFIQSPVPANNHNQYIANNVDLYSASAKLEFNDWIVGANYAGGVQINSLKYNELLKRELYDDDYEHAFRQNPFNVEFTGSLDTSPFTGSAHAGGDTWSVYPFWENGTKASNLKYVTQSDTSITFFSYFKGKRQLRYTINDGKVQKLHNARSKAELINASMILYTGKPYQEGMPWKCYCCCNTQVIRGKFGLVNNGLTTSSNIKCRLGNGDIVLIECIYDSVGYNARLDYDLYQLNLTFNDMFKTEHILYLDVAESVPQVGDYLFAICGNEIVRSQVLKQSATDYYQCPRGQVYTDYLWNDISYGLYASRVGELITNFPAKVGDSGNPVVDANGKFVGFINSLDVAGSGCGIVKINNILPMIDSYTRIDTSSAISTINGIDSIANKKYDNDTSPDSENKFSIVAHNPRTNKMYFYHSGTGTGYMLMKTTSSGYPVNERGIAREMYGDELALSDWTINNKIYHTRNFRGGFLAFFSYNYTITTNSNVDFLFAEELHGHKQANGPKLIFLGYQSSDLGPNQTPVGGVYTRNIFAYPVLVSGVPGSPDIFDNTTTQIQFPLLNDLMYTTETMLDGSRINFKIISRFTGTRLELYPSWYINLRDEAADTICVYPFNKLAVNPLWPTSLRLLNTIKHINLPPYSELGTYTLSVKGYGNYGGLIKLAKTISIGEYFDGKHWENSLDGKFTPLLGQGWDAEKRSISKINGISVNGDTLEETLLSIPYVKGGTVDITYKTITAADVDDITNNIEYNETVKMLPFRDNVAGLI